MRILLRKCAIALGVVLLACQSAEITSSLSDTNDTNTPATVVITPPASPELLVGSSVSLVAAVRNASGQDIATAQVAWSSSDATVASVSAAGIVTGLKPGTALITGAAGGKSASITITVKAPAVAKVTVSVLNAINVGDAIAAVATATDATGSIITGRATTWTSRDAAIATVSALGVVTGVRAGSTTIEATIDGVAGAATVVVTARPDLISSIAVALPESLVVTAGKVLQASAVAKNAAGEVLANKALTWESSNTAVATVSALGVVTAVANGTATITARGEGVAGSVTLTVAVPAVMPVATVQVTAPATALVEYQETQATAVAKDAQGNVLARTAAWSSSDPVVATVSSTGVITANRIGTATITAVVDGVSATLRIEVIPSTPAGLSLSAALTSVPVGETIVLSALVRDAQGNQLARGITWVSSAPAVATVSAAGLVTGVSLGTTTITASSAGVSAQLVITVTPSAVATIAITAPQTLLQPTQTTQSAVVLKDAALNVLTGRAIAYTSSNTAVATVNATGLITAVAGGTAQITAESEGKSAAVTIVVPAVAVVTVNSATTILQPTQTTQLSFTMVDAQSNPVTNRPTVWASSNPAVATVSSSGLVTAVGAGTAQVTVTIDGVTGTRTITVPAVATVTVAGTNLFPNPQQTTQLAVTLVDASATPALNRTVVWTSSAPAVATVSSTGLVTALTVGTTTVTATSEGKAGTVAIQVVPVVASVAVSGPASSLLVGQTTQLSSLIKDSFGTVITTITPTWTSSDPSRATVSATGLVTQVAGGTLANVTFTAAVGAVTGTKVISLVGHPPETIAALPQTFLNTAVPAAPVAGGQVFTPTNSTQLTVALANAQPGDVIELVNGTVYNGNFVLPNKNTTSTDWITIRPQSMANMPAPGTRMRPSIAAAANLPVLQSQNNTGALSTAPGAHHYRVIGLEITVPSNVVNTGLVRMGDDGGNGQTTAASIPHNLVLDRLYIHGTATGVVRRCVALNSASTAIIDSWISDCHDLGSDAQAIAGWNGPGPFKIVNNYLEGSGENVIFGGTDPGVPNLVPSDIEIRQNHFFKPIAWKGVWLVKNLLELKNARRVLIEGNVMENNWQDGQTGSAMLLKSVNQGNTAPWSGTVDVTVRYNLIRNVGSGFAIAGSPDNNFPDIPLTRVTIHDNIMSGINASAQFNGAGIGVLWGDIPSDVTFAHNTLLSPTNTAMAMGPQGTTMSRISIRDNIIGGGAFGVKGAGAAAGTGTINMYMPNGSFVANALIQSSTTGYPASTLFASSETAVGFANLAGLDLRLSGSSTFRNKGSDGADLGADADAVSTATAGVVVTP